MPSFEKIKPVLRRLGRAHRAALVATFSYPFVGQQIIDTMRELDPDWTEELAEIWVSSLLLLSFVEANWFKNVK